MSEPVTGWDLGETNLSKLWDQLPSVKPNMTEQYQLSNKLARLVLAKTSFLHQMGPNQPSGPRSVYPQTHRGTFTTRPPQSVWLQRVQLHSGTIGCLPIQGNNRTKGRLPIQGTNRANGRLPIQGTKGTKCRLPTKHCPKCYQLPQSSNFQGLKAPNLPGSLEPFKRIKCVQNNYLFRTVY